jgi:hypothetical protein
VLTPDGLLILSCPNRAEYRDRRGFENPFHVKELYRAELAQLVSARFAESVWYGQRPTFFSLIAPEHAARPAGQLIEVDEDNPAEAAPELAEPLYFVVVASRSAAAIAALPPVISVFSDRGDWVHRDYEKVMRDAETNKARGDALERQMADRERSIDALREEAQSLQHAREELRHALEAREASLSMREADVAARDQAIVEKGP